MLRKKLTRLVTRLEQMQRVAICYSGGVDSSLLLRVAKQTLGSNVLAVTAESPIYPQEQLRFARRMAKDFKARHKIIKFDIFKIPTFIKNPVNRCYYCKRELFGRIWSVARKAKINFLLDGSNASDSQDFRPGNQAKREFNVCSPLEECAISKQDVYRLSKLLGLPTWDKPNTVCFASRIPYGQEISLKDLEMIQKAERYIRGFGFQQVRLRHYNLSQVVGNRALKNGQVKLACIELDKKHISRLAGSCRLMVGGYLKRLGYDYITLDLEGYRSGSLNKFISFNSN
ncbi:MAG: ATP-dependent sacrificial sulfur transferase LarE [Candidatus Omnitrophota bacterium]|jgi:uncharacterized protein